MRVRRCIEFYRRTGRTEASSRRFGRIWQDSMRFQLSLAIQCSMHSSLRALESPRIRDRNQSTSSGQSSSPSLRNCSVADSLSSLRLIVVDLFTFLMDHREHSRIQPTFVLVSANPTAYFYAISKLRERGVKVILIGNGTRQLASEGRADVVLDWREICGTMFPGANSNSVGRGFNELSRFVRCFSL